MNLTMKSMRSIVRVRLLWVFRRAKNNDLKVAFRGTLGQSEDQKKQNVLCGKAKEEVQASFFGKSLLRPQKGVICIRTTGGSCFSFDNGYSTF
eukprot:jgi/Botrbrau1/9834/Bobra.0313s0012.1